MRGGMTEEPRICPRVKSEAPDLRSVCGPRGAAQIMYGIRRRVANGSQAREVVEGGRESDAIQHITTNG